MEEQTTKPSSNPITWVVLIIVVLALLIGGYFLFFQEEATNINTVIVTSTTVNENTNTAIDTSDWQVYTNEKYGFSFTYPADWHVLDSPDNTIPGPEALGIGFGGASMSFRVDVKDPTYYECSFFEDCISRYPFPESEITSNPLNVMIDGQDAIYQVIERPNSGNWIHHVWYMYPNENYMVIHTVSSISENATTKPVYDAIISTFNFK